MRSRRNTYKAKGPMEADDRRKRREEQQVSIRRQKREEQVSKRRHILPSSGANSDDESIGVDTSNTDEAISGLFSEDRLRHLASVATLRKILTTADPPIERMIERGVVPRLTALLASDNEMLQFEAAWALTNIAGGTPEETRAILDANAAPRLVQLLYSPSAGVREQAVWALGNIAGDGPPARAHLLERGALRGILRVLEEPVEPAVLRTAAWALSNLCRHMSACLDTSAVAAALPTVLRLLDTPDGELLIDACWALTDLCEKTNAPLAARIGACYPLVTLLAHPSPGIITPALLALKNITAADDHTTNSVVAAGALPVLVSLLAYPGEAVRRDAALALSNVTAGPPEHIQAAFDAGAVPPLVRACTHGDPSLRKEACWALANATAGEPEQVRYLVKEGAIPPLCSMLTMGDTRITLVVLDALASVLRVGEMDRDPDDQWALNEYALVLEEAGGLETVHGLLEHDNVDVFNLAYHIMSTYFAELDDDF
ncbi:armadillo-type protein [Schizophyllum fasciatum]